MKGTRPDDGYASLEAQLQLRQVLYLTSYPRNRAKTQYGFSYRQVHRELANQVVVRSMTPIPSSSKRHNCTEVRAGCTKALSRPGI